MVIYSSTLWIHKLNLSISCTVYLSSPIQSFIIYSQCPYYLCIFSSMQFSKTSSPKRPFSSSFSLSFKFYKNANITISTAFISKETLLRKPWMSPMQMRTCTPLCMHFLLPHICPKLTLPIICWVWINPYGIHPIECHFEFSILSLPES